jgi:hypothetical protein
MKRPGVIAHGWLSTLLALPRRAFLMIIMSVPGIAFGASFDDAAVLPDPPLAGQRLSFVATLPAISCFNDLIVRDVVTTGREIKISYSITPAVTPICFSTSPPLFLNEPIGVLAPGSYTVRALGDFNGVPVTPVEVRFNVPTSPAAAVEYYRAEADHYFIASALDEIAKLDAGDFDGWQRTGQSFPVVPATLSIAAGFSPVCRYYGKPEAGLDSHFYSASPAECATVVERFADAWLLESASVFSVALPSAIDGQCEPGSTPVYRLFNNRPDVNHRYTTSLSTRDEMIAAGWVPEGFGPQAVAMCAP